MEATDYYRLLSTAAWPNFETDLVGPAGTLLVDKFPAVSDLYNSLDSNSDGDMRGMVLGLVAFGQAIAHETSFSELPNDAMNLKVLSQADEEILNELDNVIVELEVYYPTFEKQISQAEEHEFHKGALVALLAYHRLLQDVFGKAYGPDLAEALRDDTFAGLQAEEEVEMAEEVAETPPAVDLPQSDILTKLVAICLEHPESLLRFRLMDDETIGASIILGTTPSIADLSAVAEIFSDYENVRLNSQNNVISIEVSPI